MEHSWLGVIYTKETWWVQMQFAFEMLACGFIVGSVAACATVLFVFSWLLKRGVIVRGTA